MQLRFWGTRGSIPAPATPAERIAQHRQLLAAYLAAGAPPAIDDFLAAQPQGRRAGYGGDTCCVELKSDSPELLVIDAGSGLRRLGLALAAQAESPRIIHILLSHYHWDHVQGLPFFVPAYLPGRELHLYSPQPHLEQVVRQQMNPSNFPVDLDYMRAKWHFHPLPPAGSLALAGWTITWLANAHPGGAWSYALTQAQRKVVYASDCEYTDMTPAALAEFVKFFSDAEALVFDAQYSLEEAMGLRYQWGHSTATIGLDLARRAGVKRLFCYHHDPGNNDTRLDELAASARQYQEQTSTGLPPCAMQWAYDGLVVEL